MDKKYKSLIVIFLIVASLIAFGRILGNDFINFDDDKYITENNHIKEGINTKSIEWAFTTTYFSNWYPLTWLSHMLDQSLFGANASGHHLVSLLWHIGSAILLFLFLSKTTGSLWPSAFVAALFALHPLRVESVAWASERKDVLSMFFGMAALYVYAGYVAEQKLTKYFFCLALFALGLMAKPMLVTLPFVMLLLDYWPLGRWQKVAAPAAASGRPEKKITKQRRAGSAKEKKIATPLASRSSILRSLLWEKAPFIFLAIVSSIVTIWAQNKGGTVASLQKIPVAERALNSIISYVSYLGKTFWPVDLAVFYPYGHSFPIWQVLGASLVLLIISAAVVYLVKRAPFLAVGWLWYLGTLFPVIGLLQAGDQAMADRYTYLPSIGIGIMLIWSIVYLLPREKLRKIILIPAAVIILSVLTFLTSLQCGYWKNSIELFNHVLQATKGNGLAHYNLAVALEKEGDVEKAKTHYIEALHINPDDYYAHTNLGVTLAAEGKLDEAIAHYLATIKINPYDADTYYNLANALDKQGKVEEAVVHYRKAIAVNPYHNRAHCNLGASLATQGKFDEAIYHYLQALQFDPNNPGIHFNLGIALAKKGELKEAIEHFRQAIYLNPNYEDARRALRLAMEIEQRQKR